MGYASSNYLVLKGTVFQNIPHEPKPVKRLIPKITKSILSAFDCFLIVKIMPAINAVYVIKLQNKNNPESISLTAKYTILDSLIALNIPFYRPGKRGSSFQKV